MRCWIASFVLLNNVTAFFLHSFPIHQHSYTFSKYLLNLFACQNVSHSLTSLYFAQILIGIVSLSCFIYFLWKILNCFLNWSLWLSMASASGPRGTYQKYSRHNGNCVTSERDVVRNTHVTMTSTSGPRRT